MIILDRVAPVLISALCLLTPLTSYAEDSLNSHFDSGSEMFNDGADIGGAFDEPAGPVKEYSPARSGPTKQPHKTRLAKVKTKAKAKKTKLLASGKGRKTSRAQKTKKNKSKPKASANDDSAAAHGAALTPSLQPVVAVGPVKAVSTPAAANVNAVSQPAAAVEPENVASSAADGHYWGSILGLLLLLSLGGAGYFMRKRSQTVTYSLGSGGSSPASSFASSTNCFSPVNTKVSSPADSKPAESFVSNF